MLVFHIHKCHYHYTIDKENKCCTDCTNSISIESVMQYFQVRCVLGLKSVLSTDKTPMMFLVSIDYDFDIILMNIKNTNLPLHVTQEMAGDYEFLCGTYKRL
jgi:hypothetical protein